jgi:hypothetical protein
MSVGPESRYTQNRHTLLSHWASAASRPYTAAIRPQQPGEQQAQAQCAQPGNRHLTQRHQPRHQQAAERQRHDGPERPELPQRLDQPADAGRKRREELVQLDLYRRIGPDERNGDRHQQDRQAETDRIRWPAAGAAAAGLEHEGTKLLGPLVRAARGRPGQLLRRRDRRLGRQGRPAIQRLTRGAGG